MKACKVDFAQFALPAYCFVLLSIANRPENGKEGNIFRNGKEGVNSGIFPILV